MDCGEGALFRPGLPPPDAYLKYSEIFFGFSTLLAFPCPTMKKNDMIT